MSGLWPYPELRLRDRTCSVNRLDISEKCFCNPTMDPDKSDKRLSRCKGVDQTCLV
jgi:hypothetical protein